MRTQRDEPDLVRKYTKFLFSMREQDEKFVTWCGDEGKFGFLLEMGMKVMKFCEFNGVGGNFRPLLVNGYEKKVEIVRYLSIMLERDWDMMWKSVCDGRFMREWREIGWKY
jgi:hypothetical protein